MLYFIFFMKKQILATRLALGNKKTDIYYWPTLKYTLHLMFLLYKPRDNNYRYIPRFIFLIEKQLLAINKLGIGCKYTLGFIFWIKTQVFITARPSISCRYTLSFIFQVTKQIFGTGQAFNTRCNSTKVKHGDIKINNCILKDLVAGLQYFLKQLYILIKLSMCKHYSAFEKLFKCAIFKFENNINNDNNIIYAYSNISTLGA